MRRRRGKADGPAQELRRAVRYARGIARREVGQPATLPRHRRMACEVMPEAIGHQRRLRQHRDIRPQRLLKHVLQQRVMRAAQNGGLRLWHLAAQGIDVAAHQRLGQDHVTVLDRIDDAAAGLRLDINADRAKGQFSLKRAATDRCRRSKEGHMPRRHLARGGIIAPLTLGQGLYQRHKDAQHTLARRHARLLHSAQRNGRGCVARQHHQIASLSPEPFNPSAGERVNIVRRAHAVRRMGVVAHIDHGLVRQPRRNSVKHGQAAQSAVENAYRHLPLLRIRCSLLGHDSMHRARRMPHPSGPKPPRTGQCSAIILCITAIYLLRLTSNNSRMDAPRWIGTSSEFFTPSRMPVV